MAIEDNEVTQQIFDDFRRVMLNLAMTIDDPKLSAVSYAQKCNENTLLKLLTLGFNINTFCNTLNNYYFNEEIEVNLTKIGTKNFEELLKW